MSLFRPQSEEARQRAWLGRILLIRPLSFTVLTACALAIAAALASLFFFGEYTRKARVAGVLSPASGIVRVTSPQAGVVDRVHIREGDAVRREAPLFSVSDRRVDVSQASIAAAVRSSLSQRREALGRQRGFIESSLAAERRGLEERAEGLRRELAQSQLEIEAQERRLALARHSAGRAAELAAMGFVSPSALDRERDASLEGELRVGALRRTRLALSRELAAITQDARAALGRANAQVAALEAQMASLEQERVERDLQYRAAIVSPVDGTVATLLVEPGQNVVPGMALASLIPAGSALEAHLYSPSRAIGFVREGQEVLLRFHAYPHQKFGMKVGRVTAVARNAMPPPELGFVPPDGGREPLYRIKVALDSQSMPAYGREEPLQAGMQVDADVLLDRRRLIEWIFEPLLSLAGRA